MAQTNFDVGTIANDGTGEPLRQAFQEQQAMNTELYTTKVDKVVGKELSSNDFTDANVIKLGGIEEGAEVNIQPDWEQSDDTADDYIKNKPTELFSSVGYFHYTDTATQTVPLTILPDTNKKLTNNGLGAQTNLTQAPYGVSTLFNTTTNEFDFSQLSIGDTLDLRVDLLLTTTSANQKYLVFLRVGEGSVAQYDLPIFSGQIKSISSDNRIIGNEPFSIDYQEHIDYPATLYILCDDDGSVKVNGWFTSIIRKSVNIVEFLGGADFVKKIGDTMTGALKINRNATATPAFTIEKDGVDYFRVTERGDLFVVGENLFQKKIQYQFPLTFNNNRDIVDKEYVDTEITNSSIVPLIDSKLEHNFVDETTTRKASSTFTFAGTVRTCGSGGTYATISAAYAACISGDIIQLADGIYDTALESGGYLLFNTALKDVLIRGNSANNAAVQIKQSAVASFCVRLRNTGNIVFQNLTITSNQTNTTVLLGLSNGGISTRFDNCIINNTGSTYVQVVYMIGPSNANSYAEFVNCTIDKGNNTSSFCIYSDLTTDANSLLYDNVLLVKNCQIKGNVLLVDSIDSHIYDSNIYDATSSSALAFGGDVLVPIYSKSTIDVRSCNIAYKTGFGGHGVLLGRGTKKVLFVNNNIYMEPSVNSLHIGIVIKSSADVLNDVVVSGNYVESPRPLYIKGGTNCILSKNTAVSNWSDTTYGLAFELNNPDNADGPIASIGNVIESNILYGIYASIGFTQNGTAVSGLSSGKLCIFRSNKHYGNLYMFNPDTTWANKSSVWNQDVNSIYLEI